MVTPGNLKHRAEFFEQLAAMIAAGVPLTRAMEMAGRTRSIGVPKKIVAELTHHLQEGHTFADAMQLVSGQKLGADGTRKRNRAYWLSEFDIALLSAGEESGRLDTTFKTLAHYYRSRAAIIRETISRSVVTIMTLHVFLLVFPIGYLQMFAMGIMEGNYSRCVPFIVEKIVAFGVLYGGMWFLAFSVQGGRGAGWRSMIETVFSVVPWLNQAIKYLAVTRLAMALEALTNAGVDVVRAWELGAASCGSSKLKREILARLPAVQAGTTPGEMVADIRYLPEMFTQLYQTGELSGKMDETLTRLHTYFEEEGFHKLQTFCRILNYVIYFTIVVMVAFAVISFWTKYFGTMLNSF